MKRFLQTYRLHGLMILLTVFVWGNAFLPVQAQNAGDSTTVHRRYLHRLGLEMRAGHIFHSHAFLRGNEAFGNPMRHHWSGHLRYSFQLHPHSPAASTYLNAYQGIGVARFDFRNAQETGSPIALYLFQGGDLWRPWPTLSLRYEWNFGLAMGWKYHNEQNPTNLVIGSKLNAYLNFGLHFNWALSPLLDLTAGASLTHFSNGNTQYPNSGLNTAEGRIGLAYNFNRRAEDLRPASRPQLPAFVQHISYDLLLFGSWRRKIVAADGGEMLAPGVYPVAGFSLAPMYELAYKWRVGVGLDGVYDHSANLRPSDSDPDAVEQPAPGRQLALGLSARAELVMPYLSVSFGLGGNVIHGGGDLKAFYQILALKLEVTRNLYLNIGYNLKNFHEPNYLMLGLGYRFHHFRPRLW